VELRILFISSYFCFCFVSNCKKMYVTDPRVERFS